MKKRPGFLHKIFSFSRYQRRFGVNKLKISSPEYDDFDSLKSQIINQGESILSRGSAKNIQEHYGTLRQEFSGQSELSFHHAMLIVMLRREIDVSLTFKRFNFLWEKQGDWLIKNLNIRWLVSACDTFADHSSNDIERSFALATTILANTVKVYETENILTNHQKIIYDPDLVDKLQTEAIPLIEGMSCFTIGTDDTLRNMVWRMNEICPNTITGKILMEVFQRLTNCESAFGRIRKHHTRIKTKFWV